MGITKTLLYFRYLFIDYREPIETYNTQNVLVNE